MHSVGSRPRSGSGIKCVRCRSLSEGKWGMAQSCTSMKRSKALQEAVDVERKQQEASSVRAVIQGSVGAHGAQCNDCNDGCGWSRKKGPVAS